MATLLMGYDTEYHAIGENLARGGGTSFYPDLPYDTTAQGVDVIKRVHSDLGVGGTLFVCGRTLVHALPAIEGAMDSGLEIQQHTYSHSLFKQDSWQGGVFYASPPEALLHEVTATSGLIKRHLGVECIGLRTPHCYYKGLSDRPDLVALLDEAGISYVSSWARNESNGNPTPFSVQPFWYEEQGYPEILELPAQFWLDAFWFEENGIDRGRDFLEALKGAIDKIVDGDLVYGACFHEWAMLRYDEAGTGWVRGLIEYALGRGVAVMSYGDYYRILAAQRAAL